jgi:hypothetical protein
MILFLNKKDLFQTKLTKVDIRNDGSDGSAPRFLDYTGEAWGGDRARGNCLSQPRFACLLACFQLFVVNTHACIPLQPSVGHR